MQIDRNVLIGLGIFATLVIVYIMFFRNKPSSDKKEGGNRPTVYGVMTCPYTVKQREKYPDYDFVDCSNGKCPDFVSAFPTTKHQDGKIEVGYS